ncbi:RNA polymerase II C-terminal domain kinase beta subunit [Penicillium angulare]|uniref:RNA polymerase II C-terminal domain kinase beta subunit n=1 Tax=Penicillium angulare TaxID=116970 RepID=A0A9W9F363_9EURO|nr:RNA polymerase II C-terminal domain kinase beta subunit [Penicillium angulare]
MFEANARGIIGLERLMLESSGFDFRTRHPHKTLFKLARRHKLPKESLHLAYRIALDVYRTYAPLKQGTPTLAFACLELSGRLLDQRIEALESEEGYAEWNTSREEVLGELSPHLTKPPQEQHTDSHIPETLFDLLELYTHHRSSTTVGPHFPADRFLTVRIPLNQEAGANQIPRFAFWTERPRHPKANNGINTEPPARLPHPLTPIAANGERHRPEKGRDAAVRFMLDPAQADGEKKQVAEYFKVETEEYEVEE